MGKCLKIGDRITIKKGLNPNMHDYISDLKQYEGQTFTIKKIIKMKSGLTHYRVIENNWTWYEEYFQESEGEGE